MVFRNRYRIVTIGKEIELCATIVDLISTDFYLLRFEIFHPLLIEFEAEKNRSDCLQTERKELNKEGQIIRIEYI